MIYPGRIPGRVRLGMSAPKDEWADRQRQVGAVFARRIFCNPISDNESGLVTAMGSNVLCLVSFKVNPYSWDQAAAGAADAQLHSRCAELAATGIPSAVVVQHEPSGDGDPATWATIQDRAERIVHQYPLLAFAVNVNGFFFKAKGGRTDAQIAQYLPPSLLERVDVTTADFYQNDGSLVSDMLPRFVAWADRVGVTELGIGEIGTYTVEEMDACLGFILERPDRFGIVCWFNSDENSRADWSLDDGDPRLASFRAWLAKSAPPQPDPRDARIADLTTQVSALQSTLARAQADAAAAAGRAQTAETEATGLRARIGDAIETLTLP